MSGERTKCPLPRGYYCDEDCEWFDHDDNCCTIRTLTRALENLAALYKKQLQGYPV